MACNVTIVDPDFTKPCYGATDDSAYYSYSIPGYDPCHWVDLSSTLEITYQLNCFEESYLELDNFWGISYDGTTTLANSNFSRILEDDTAHLSLSNFTKFNMEFRIQNWNWLTQFVTFTSEVTTLDQLYGSQNLTAKIDFSQIPEEDLKYYTPGGRLYMYPHSTSSRLSIKTYGFFFEVEGYNEPIKGLDIIFIVIVTMVSLAFVAFIGLVIFCYAKKYYDKKKLLKSAEAD
jgi:hypothetical protein